MNSINDISIHNYDYLQIFIKIKKNFPALFCETNVKLKSSYDLIRGNKLVRQKKMAIDGYFQENSALRQYQSEIKSLVVLVKYLDDFELPPVLLFYTDFAWVAFQSLNDLFAEQLGNDFMFLPDFWAWHVDPKKTQTGWTPHRDKGGKTALFEDGSLKSLTCWIPLTEANPLNGCMYVVPKQHDFNYGVEEETGFNFRGLQSIRALPGNPGDIFIWDQSVLHWGSKTSQFEEKPRISMALEVQSVKIKPFNNPLINPNQIIDETLKLNLIGKQILQYKHMHHLNSFQEKFAVNLINHK